MLARVNGPQGAFIRGQGFREQRRLDMPGLKLGGGRGQSMHGDIDFAVKASMLAMRGPHVATRRPRCWPHDTAVTVIVIAVDVARSSPSVPHLDRLPPSLDRLNPRNCPWSCARSASATSGVQVASNAIIVQFMNTTQGLTSQLLSFGGNTTPFSPVR